MLDKQEEVQTYRRVLRRARIDLGQDYKHARRSTADVQQYVRNSGVLTLDDIYGTLSVHSFSKFNMPVIYDDYGNKYKEVRDTSNRSRDFYVLYKRSKQGIRRLKVNQVVQLYTGTRKYTFTVTNVVEDNDRILSARISVI